MTHTTVESGPSGGGGLYTRKNPYLAQMTVREQMTRPGSGKATFHLVLDVNGSGMHHTPGDSLAVIARNPLPLVDELIKRLGFDPEARVPVASGMEETLRHVLEHRYILNRASKKFAAALVSVLPEGKESAKAVLLAQDSKVAEEYVYTRDYVDILAEFPGARFDSPAAFLALLSPIPPRLYSIASSMVAHPAEIHLCVGVVRYETHGRLKKGLCSGFLGEHALLHRQDIPIYVQESRTFRLPADRDLDIIMVGPGTGIAPFRAFIEQRISEGARGRHWLFFGEQHRATDFLYEAEWLEYHRKGVLHRLDLAFSRDQQHKIYVQHRMKEQAGELWRWLEKGAYFYVCGDARRMAKDVHQTLIEIVGEEGRVSQEAAREHVEVTLMKKEKRYLRDVY